MKLSEDQSQRNEEIENLEMERLVARLLHNEEEKKKRKQQANFMNEIEGRLRCRANQLH